MKATSGMKIRYALFPVIATTVWVGLSEFTRNQILFKSYWIDHYHNLGLLFPQKTINGAVWGIWSLGFSVFIYIVSKRFSIAETTAICWLAGFILMWLAIGNLGVLPTKLLLFAIPLSIIEAFVAAWLAHKLEHIK